MNVYGPRIARARKLAGLTQEGLAERMGVDVQTVKRKESPGGKEPKPYERLAIARICGIDLDYIEGKIEDPLEGQDETTRTLLDLADQLKATRELVAGLVPTVAQHARELEELRTERRQETRGGGDHE